MRNYFNMLDLVGSARVTYSRQREGRLVGASTWCKSWMFRVNTRN